MNPTRATFSNKINTTQILVIQRKTKAVRISCTGIRFIDKDTKQIVMHVPAVDITGYGDTDAEAQGMLQFSANEFIFHLLQLKEKDMNMELARLGWKHNQMVKKEFSKTFVDGDGNLSGFNAVDGEIQYIGMEMAA